MSLSKNLINQFVKVVNYEKKESKESTVNGTYKLIDGVKYVQIDGSDIWTPVNSMVQADDGDRVKVSIKDHNATITGNITNPSAGSSSVQDLKDTVDDHGNTIKQINNSIEQQGNSIIQIDNSIKQVENTILQYDNTINQQNNKIQQFENTINQQNNTIEQIGNDISQVGDQIESMNNTIISQGNTITQHDNMITQQNNKIEQQGNIITQHGTTLETFDSDIKILNSAFVIKDGVLTGLNKVIIDDLETNSLNAKYANIDFSNIKIAAIEKLFTDSGIIKDLIVSEGKITGELVGVTIKGDLIEGNTIKADRLVVKGENGLYYKLNLDSLGEVTVSSDEKYQNGLDGSVIIAKSITAEKVAVNDLVAFDATIGGFNITNNSIYSGAKNSADNTTRGIYMDKTGQFSIGDSNNFLRYILDPNKRTYKLEISARSIVFGASNQNIEEVINDIQETTKKAVKTVNVLYALSDSSTEAPSTGWSAVAPNWTENKYMWQKTVITYIDDEVLESNPTCIQGAKGDKGEIYKKASGNYLTLTESGSHKIKYLDIIGGSRQEVEEGINKAIIPDREETFNGMSINIKNGIINITGKSSVTYTSYRIIGSAELEAGKTYYLRLFGNKSGSASLRNDTESVWFPDSENNENQFTPTVGGTYNIQLGFGSGENQNWNARYSISETSNADWVEGKEQKPTLENPSEVEAVGNNVNIFNKYVATKGYYIDSKGQVTAFSTNVFYASDYMEVLQSTQYTYSNTTILTDYAAKGAFYDQNKNFIKYFDIDNKTTTITTPSNCKYIRMSVRGEDINAFRIEKGSSITSYQKNLKIVTNNKNFLKFPDLNVTVNGVNIQVTNGNHFKITGTPTGIVNKILYDYTYFKDINKIAYNRYPITISRNTDERLPFELNFASDKSNWYMQIARDTVKQTKNVLDNYFNRIAFYTGTLQGELNYEFDLQLEISNETTDIIEAKNNRYILPLQKPFYKLYSESEYGTVYDHFIIRDGKRYEQHNIRKFNLSEFDWEVGAVQPGTNVNTLRWNTVTPINGLTIIDKGALSNYFKNLAGNFYSTDEVSFRIEHNKICVRLPKTIATTTSQVKQYFKNLEDNGRGCYVVVSQSEPELIECTEEQNNNLDSIMFYDDITNIYADDELATMDLEYWTYYKGDNGNGIESTIITYQASLDGTTIPNGEWSSSIPTVAAGSYLWTKTLITYTDGSTTSSYAVGKMGDTGADGKGIKSAVTTYQIAANGTTIPKGEWSPNPPATTAEKPYLWSRTVTTYTDESTSEAYAVGSTPEGINIGSRNFLRNSSFSKSLDMTNMTRQTCNNITTIEIKDNVGHLVTPNSGNSNNGIIWYWPTKTQPDDINFGDVLTFSVDIKSNKKDITNKPFISIHSNFTETGNWWYGTGNKTISKTIDITTEWKRFYVTLNIPDKDESFDEFILGVAIHGNINNDLYFRNFKLEKGNKATDWTPAPEDIDDSIDSVQSSANQAQTIANNAQTIAESASSKIEILSNTISNLITDENGGSLMTQGPNGWTFNMSSISSNLDTIKESINNIEHNNAETNNVLNNLSDLIDSVADKTAYITMSTDDEGNPCIELGKADNLFKVRITNTAIDFMEGSTKIAYVNNSTFYTNKIIVKSELQIGEGPGFVWRTRENGNMGLVSIS